MKAAVFIARYLAARGVTHAFGHPGSDVMDLIAAMEDVGITFVLTHHENSAAYMAATLGRLTNTPGVALVTKGPGVTNIATGMGSAHLDRAPLILFSSLFGADDSAINVRQHIPSVRFYEPLTKLSTRWTAGDIHEVLPNAVAAATTGYPGAVFLGSLAAEQLADIAVSDTEAHRLIAEPPATATAAFDDATFDVAAHRIAAARRLLVVVGPGVEHAGARDEMLDAISALGAPVCVTPEAVGWVPADHPLYAGMLGWHDKPLVELSEAADVIVTFGLDGADLMVRYKGGAAIVNLAPLGGDPPAFQPVAASVAGDLKPMLGAVARAGRGDREWAAPQAKATRDAIDDLMSVSAAHDPAEGIAPQEIFTVGRQVLPADAIFTCDVGAHKIVAGTAWKSTEADSFLISNGFGSMGYGLPSAIGAKIARPDNTVLSVIGDGGLLMYAGDLATWARLGLAMTVVVMVDNDLTQVQRRQERQGYSVASTSFQSIDYCALAASFGIEGVRVETTAQYRDAVKRAAATDRPLVIEAILDSQEYRRIPGWR
jgi:acetolactate synthase I/II/III large subunit